MTLKDLYSVAGGEIYVTAFDCDGPAYLVTDYLRGSSGFMSFEIARLGTYNGLDFLAHIDISPNVLRLLERESNDYYNRK
jgi:hypothetical protein